MSKHLSVWISHIKIVDLWGIWVSILLESGSSAYRCNLRGFLQVRQHLQHQRSDTTYFIDKKVLGDKKYVFSFNKEAQRTVGTHTDVSFMWHTSCVIYENHKNSLLFEWFGSQESSRKRMCNNLIFPPEMFAIAMKNY